MQTAHNFRVIIVICSFVAFFSSGCLTTIKTAKITPVGTNSHTLSCEAISAGWSSVKDVMVGASYTFRRGFTNKFEAGFGVDAIVPQLSIGCKYGFTKSIALDANIKVFYNPFYDGSGSRFYPNLDLALIFGSEKLYGGIKYLAITGSNSTGELYPFGGIRLHLKNNFCIFPEVGLGLVELDYYRKKIGLFYTSFGPFLGLGFSF
jgi:hypothetical protein